MPAACPIGLPPLTVLSQTARSDIGIGHSQQTANAADLPGHVPGNGSRPTPACCAGSGRPWTGCDRNQPRQIRWGRSSARRRTEGLPPDDLRLVRPRSGWVRSRRCGFAPEGLINRTWRTGAAGRLPRERGNRHRDPARLGPASRSAPRRPGRPARRHHRRPHPARRVHSRPGHAPPARRGQPPVRQGHPGQPRAGREIPRRGRDLPPAARRRPGAPAALGRPDCRLDRAHFGGIDGRPPSWPRAHPMPAVSWP